MLRLLAINALNPVDIGFFVACGVIIAICVAIYFLIPVFNKKQYQEQRENLKKREEAFRANAKPSSVAVAEEAPAEENISADVLVEEQSEVAEEPKAEEPKAKSTKAKSTKKAKETKTE